MASSSCGGGKRGNSKRSRVIDSSVSQRGPNPPRQNSGELAFLDSQHEARGMITSILKHPALAIRFLPGLNVIEGETRLKTNVFQNMHLFHIDDETQDVCWAVDSRNFLRIDHQNTQLLSLSNLVYNSFWRLTSNLGVPMTEPDYDSDENEPIPDATKHDVVTPVQQEPFMHPYHDMYMQELHRLHEDNRCLHRDYSELYDSVCEINTEMVEFREEFYTFIGNQQARNQHLYSLVTGMHRVICFGGQPTRPPYYP
ncbi:unnamed protein product [Lactuca virosa]|uniref:Uncharacterized protein n=1 Tax=Lactuca virosa TaxID=75947 RepID=A0AAU9M3W3_9ASTR|nr:unnamed protein product [Lactuca virosa]